MTFDERAARRRQQIPTVEADVEDAVAAWAENHGWIVRSMKYRGRRGCRDKDFYGFGQIVMVEFKRPKEVGVSAGKLSGNQIQERKRLAEVGVTVHVIDTVKDGIALLRRHMS